jgi:hypothetical protein
MALLYKSGYATPASDWNRGLGTLLRVAALRAGSSSAQTVSIRTYASPSLKPGARWA